MHHRNGRGEERPGPVGPRGRAVLVLGILLLPFLASCDRGAPPVWTPEVLRMLPHDPAAYTQGLLLHEGRFFESTGRYGQSELREVDPESGAVLRAVPLEEDYFGEGLALVDDRLIQLTWKEGLAFIYDLVSFERIGEFSYDTEGWGLCYDGRHLYMTTGGSMLYRRDPETFEVLGREQITLNGHPLWRVNELACVGEHIYANVFMTDRIVKIEKDGGRVVAEIDASRLVPEGGRPASTDAVLNGIAHDPADDTFYLTGKLWPTVFHVRFVPG